jgi:hypothetical protein
MSRHLCFSLHPGLLHEMYWYLVLSIRSLIPVYCKREEVSLSGIFNSCHCLPETKRHSCLFLQWSGSKFRAVVPACTHSIHVLSLWLAGGWSVCRKLSPVWQVSLRYSARTFKRHRDYCSRTFRLADGSRLTLRVLPRESDPVLRVLAVVVLVGRPRGTGVLIHSLGGGGGC